MTHMNVEVHHMQGTHLVLEGRGHTSGYNSVLLCGGFDRLHIHSELLHSAV